SPIPVCPKKALLPECPRSQLPKDHTDPLSKQRANNPVVRSNERQRRRIRYDVLVPEHLDSSALDTPPAHRRGKQSGARPCRCFQSQSQSFRDDAPSLKPSAWLD